MGFRILLARPIRHILHELIRNPKWRRHDAVVEHSHGKPVKKVKSLYKRTTSRVLRSILATIAWSLFPAVAMADWYNESQFQCSDPFQVRSFARNAGLLDSKIPFDFVEVADGKVYVDIPAVEVAELPTLRSDLLALNSNVFDADVAKELVVHLEGVQSDLEVPLLVQNLPSLAGYWVTNTSSLVIGGVFSYLFNETGAKALSLSQVLPLVASGGELTEFYTLRQIGEKHVLLSSLRYVVEVGNETRTVWLAACTYPAIVNHTRFRTTLGVNDKILVNVDGKWYIEDATTGARDPGHLELSHEDYDFLYFKAIDVSAFFEDYRIAKYGGPFEVNDEGVWTNLYSSTKPE